MIASFYSSLVYVGSHEADIMNTRDGKNKSEANYALHSMDDVRICSDGYTRKRAPSVTPAVYPRLLEFLHVDIQSTGQKSQCVNAC